MKSLNKQDLEKIIKWLVRGLETNKKDNVNLVILDDLLFLIVMMNKKFLENIKKFNMIRDNDFIIAAVSGGVDSIFLLYNLIELKKYYNIEILVAHVNHGIRESANRDEKYVELQAKKFNLKFESIKVDMKKYAFENKLSDEEAGRILRYEFFRQLSDNKEKIFLAHNANDQAETVLQRIIRGTGIGGLVAMEFISDDLYRPMLNINRKEIEKFMEENQIYYVQDETNFMDIYGRNKIRLNVIPYIEENFNENFIDCILRLSYLADGNMHFINKMVSQYLKHNEYNNILNIENLKEEDSYFISEVVRGFLKKRLGNLEGISSLHINNIVKIIRNKTSSRTMINNNRIIEVSYNNLYVINMQEDICEIEIPLNDGVNTIFDSTIYLQRSFKSIIKKNTISIDASKVKNKLTIRHRRNGDKFIPLGMSKYKKLKDFFIDEKISRNMRDKVLLVCDGDQIVWVVPYRMNELYKIDKTTKKIINLTLERKK